MSAGPLRLAALLVVALNLTPFVVAALRPPPGLAFIGTFHYGDDFYNYLSYAQQAEDGAFVFRNKVLLDDHRPALVNLEWWLVGVTSRLLGGGRLLLAYRLFAVLASFGFLWAADRWLRRLGVAETHRLPALLLVATGGGLGGMLYTFTPRSLPECLDLFAGLFPFLGLLTNPHFTAGTTLLLLGLLAYETARGARGLALATLVATVAALVRPYDFVLIVAVRSVAVLLLEPRARWIRALLPLALTLPVVGYLYWLFYRNPAFAFYAQTPYVFPPLADLLPALGPAMALALLGVFCRALNEEARRARLYLLVWAGVVLVALVKPVHFSLQFFGGIGFPFLALGALGLARFRPALTLGATLVFSTSLLVALRFVSTPQAYWFATRGDLAAVEALRPACRPGDVLFSPPSMGLYATGLTACRAFVSHRVAPTYERHLQLAQRFGGMAPAERTALLDAYKVRLLVLPGDAGPRPTAWLGTDTQFARRGLVDGPPQFGIYERAEGKR